MKRSNKGRLFVALLTFLYLFIAFMIFLLSPTTAIVVLATLVIVFIVVTWAKFATTKLKIKRALALIIGLLSVFLTIIMIMFFIVPLVLKQVPNFYNLVLDFFPSDDKTISTGYVGTTLWVLEVGNRDRVIESQYRIILDRMGASKEQMIKEIEDYLLAASSVKRNPNYLELQLRSATEKLKEYFEEVPTSPDIKKVEIYGALVSSDERIFRTKLENKIKECISPETVAVAIAHDIAARLSEEISQQGNLRDSNIYVPFTIQSRNALLKIINKYSYEFNPDKTFSEFISEIKQIVDEEINTRYLLMIPLPEGEPEKIREFIEKELVSVFPPGLFRVKIYSPGASDVNSLKAYYMTEKERSELQRYTVNFPDLERAYIVIMEEPNLRDGIKRRVEEILETYKPIGLSKEEEKYFQRFTRDFATNLASNFESYDGNWLAYTNELLDWFNVKRETKASILLTTRTFLLELKVKLRDYTNSMLEKIPNIASETFTIVFFVVIGSIYTSFYFAFFKRLAPKLYPRQYRRIAANFLRELHGNMERYILSILFIALIVGITVGLLIKFLGLGYSLLIGFWAAITNLVPVVGVIFEIVPIILLIAAQPSLSGLIILVIALIAIHSAAFIIFLKLMGDSNRVNPVMVILLVLFMGQLLGILGAFLAAPVAILLKQLWKHFFEPWLESKNSVNEASVAE
ncbi:MAG: hypothetical protein PWQ27_795 [Kosmotoga sp.]|nr:hypothetical protein [Kosmotoga sp.]